MFAVDHWFAPCAAGACAALTVSAGLLELQPNVKAQQIATESTEVIERALRVRARRVRFLCVLIFYLCVLCGWFKVLP
jgi:hypothetical protein